MKKIFFFAAALAATVSMNAQIEVFRPATYENPVITNDKETTGDVEAGTVYYTGTAFDVLNAFAAKPQYVNTFANDYDRVEFAGETIDLSTGLQACSAVNPVDADGKNPAMSFVVPEKGGVFQINAKADGKMLVFHKASSNKNYMVFEAGSALGYDFVEQTNKTDVFEANGLLKYTVIGDAGNYNHVTLADVKVVNGQGKEFTAADFSTAGVQWPEKYYEPAADVKVNGLGVIAFDIADEITYLVHACGSKLSAAAFVYVPAGITGDVVLKGKADAETVPADLVLYTIAAGTGLNDVEAVKAIKKMVNGQLVIEKNGVLYNVLGAQL